MKMLLASKEKFLIDKGYSILGIPKNEMRIGAINTAFNAGIDEAYIQYMKEYRDDMKSNGVYFEEFDIKEKSKDEILNFFKDKNIIQVYGGNPFYFFKIAREVGFEDILKQLLDDGLVYVGCSTGSHIMSPSIILATLKKGRDWFGVTDFTAYGYVPYLIRPHYNKSMDEDLRKISKDTELKIRLITDDQAILVEDDKETFIGGPEIILK